MNEFDGMIIKCVTYCQNGMQFKAYLSINSSYTLKRGDGTRKSYIGIYQFKQCCKTGMTVAKMKAINSSA